MTTLKPTEKELEILHILWEKGPASVHDVHEAMGGESANGYTTILKLLQIMHDKGLVSRTKEGRLHLYSAIPTLEGTRRQLLDRMIESVFKGSAAQLVISALGNSAASKEELDAIKAYLKKLEDKKK